jgi:rhamnogalacturonan endolyase
VRVNDIIGTLEYVADGKPANLPLGGPELEQLVLRIRYRRTLRVREVVCTDRTAGTPALLSAAIVEPAASLSAYSQTNPQPARQMELLNRGVVAVRTSSTGVFLSWRLLGTDPPGTGFNLYRNGTKINSSVLAAGTNFSDTTANLTIANSYFVRPVINGVEQAPSETYTLAANSPVRQYLNIPLQIPPGGTTPDGNPYTYNANDASVGDVDGDGQYEIILKWDSSLSKDSSQDGFTGNTYLDCYTLSGTRLWRIDEGQNIRAGAHYTQFIVYDLDGDGKAEVALKTAPGTIDGQGHPVLLPGDSPGDDYRNATSGRINSGPEYLTIFNGLTGGQLATVPYKPDRVATSSWGDDYGNRQDRYLMAVAYLDGQRPSLVIGRGLFPGQSSGHAVRNELTAWDWRNGQLSMRWWFRADNHAGSFGIPDVNTAYVGQGNYEMHPADVDGDGRDEIVFGSMTVDDNGQGLYSTGLGHGDALHVTDMIPSNPGLEIYMPMESPAATAT